MDKIIIMALSAAITLIERGNVAEGLETLKDIREHLRKEQP